MKRRNCIRELVDSGCHLKRHGYRHDIYANSRNGKQVTVPRHPEIRESLAELIKKRLAIG